MASIPPPSPTRKEVRPKKPTPVDDDLSVFNIHNIFCHCWFLSRANLLANVISTRKEEDRNISWVEFTPQYHSHLVKCAVALVPHPVTKVEWVMFAFIWSCLMGKVTWPSSNSRRVATRPIMPRRRSGVLHGRGAERLSEKGNRKLRKRWNFPLVSVNAWHVDISSSPAKPPASTSAPNPKWSACRRNRLQLKRCHTPPLLPHRTSRWPPPLPMHPLPHPHHTVRILHQ